jgi:hypothetical protein
MIWTTKESWLDFKQGKGNLYSANLHTDSGARTVSHSWTPGTLFSGIKWQGMKLTTQLHLVPRLRMRGAVGTFLLLLLWCARRRLCLHQYLYIIMLWQVLPHFFMAGCSCISHTEWLKQTHKPKEEILSLFIKFRIRNYWRICIKLVIKNVLKGSAA